MVFPYSPSTIGSSGATNTNWLSVRLAVSRSPDARSSCACFSAPATSVNGVEPSAETEACGEGALPVFLSNGDVVLQAVRKSPKARTFKKPTLDDFMGLFLSRGPGKPGALKLIVSRTG